MDSDAFTTALFKWDPRTVTVLPSVPPLTSRPQLLHYTVSPPTEIEEMFQTYGVRCYTAAKIVELGFTVRTLVDMKDDELDDMMNSLSQIFRWDLLVGERYGIKAAVRAQRRRIESQDITKCKFLHSTHTNTNSNSIDALSQEGLSSEAVGSTWEVVGMEKKSKKQRKREKMNNVDDEKVEEEEENNEGENKKNGSERQREHPFIVTEPGEVARGKKNGLDYLFHLYEQCHKFLILVQAIAKDRGQKCPNKVTNEVFRYAKKAGANYINKPKMRHYVHCYALHCLDEEVSNELRRGFKERGENVGAWREACYKPLVAIVARQGYDIDAIFNSHPRLSIWYVPTKLRQLSHSHRINATHHLHF